jgi:hypothetical protein
MKSWSAPANKFIAEAKIRNWNKSSQAKNCASDCLTGALTATSMRHSSEATRADRSHTPAWRRAARYRQFQRLMTPWHQAGDQRRSSEPDWEALRPTTR